MRSLSLTEISAEFGSRTALIDGDHGKGLTYQQLAEAVRLPPTVDGQLGPQYLEGSTAMETVVEICRNWEHATPTTLFHPRYDTRQRSAIKQQLATCNLHKDTANVLWTSGTTGVPKGVQLSQSNLITAAAAHWQHSPSDSDCRWLLNMPTAHIAGLGVIARCLVGGGCVVRTSATDAESIISIVRKYGVTHMSVVPTVLYRLLASGQRDWWHSLDQVLVGGAPCDAALLTQGRELGLPLLTTYGQTETCAQIATQRQCTDGCEGVGTPLAGIEIKISDEQILARGRQVMLGYVGHEPRAPQDWWNTGDYGRWLDDGQLRILARREDLIISGGENVYPNDVEDLLREVTFIREAVVVGLPDLEWGQKVTVVLQIDNTVPNNEYCNIVENCRKKSEQIPVFARPKKYYFTDEFPYTDSHKIDRRAIANSVISGKFVSY